LADRADALTKIVAGKIIEVDATGMTDPEEIARAAYRRIGLRRAQGVWTMANANAVSQNTTQQIRDIRDRLKLLDEIERDVDTIVRKQTLIFALLALPHNGSTHRSTKDTLGRKRIG
jgi:hypothetical protein